MNIDLRNISQEFENQVNSVKQEFGFNTNSKAVEFCTLNFMDQKATIERLRKILNEQHNELESIKKDVKIFTSVLTRLNQIT